MLTARAVGRQVITSLNHLGTYIISYHETMEWVKRLARETAMDSTLREGHWIVVFDNVSFQKRVRHERQHRHTESIMEFYQQTDSKSSNDTTQKWINHKVQEES